MKKQIDDPIAALGNGAAANTGPAPKRVMGEETRPNRKAKRFELVIDFDEIRKYPEVADDICGELEIEQYVLYVLKTAAEALIEGNTCGGEMKLSTNDAVMCKWGFRHE